MTRSLQSLHAFATTAALLELTIALLGLVATLLAAALAWQLAARGALAQRQVLQREALAWQCLQPGWPWRCDAQWRLAPLQAEAGALAGRAGDDLRRLFEDAEPASSGADFHALLASRARVRGRRVRLRGSDAPMTVHAQPLFDEAGQWQGYVGVLQQDFAGGGAADMALLSALLAAPQPPSLVLRCSSVHAPWTAQPASAAGRAWWAERGIADGRGLDRQLPVAVQQLLATATAVGSAQADGWTLQTVCAPDGAGGGCALLFAPTEPTSTDDEDALSFSYTLSHDLRAPVRVVEGFARIIKEDYGHALDRVGNDHLDRVLGAAARMNQMIDALLAMARLSTQPLARQSVNLSRLAQFVVDDLRRSAPERAIEIVIDPELTVHGDPTLLRQVLENLIGNAWKYTQRQHEPRVRFGCEQLDGRRVFFVRDNGAGFDMRGVDRLFGLFQRLHGVSDFPGTGVGLASVKRIVNRHGGRTWAESEPGQGASFYFTLRD